MSKQELQMALERRMSEVSLFEVSKEMDEFLKSKRIPVGTAYEEWFLSRSAEEIELHNKICIYQDRYFADMTLKKYAKELMKTNLMTGRSYVRTDILDCLSDTLPGQWRFMIVPDRSEWDGMCYPADCHIEITRSHRNDRITILHEMIHAYEAILTPYAMYKEWLMLRLYRDLSKKIRELDSYLSRNLHPDLYVHGTLFALKSFDLDLRLKKPLGTVYAYGRDDLFK
jgi:hypothetical protein